MSSDHNLVLCNLKLKLKHFTSKKYEKKRNIQALDDDITIRAKYEAEIAKRIRDAEMENLIWKGRQPNFVKLYNRQWKQL